MNTRALLLACSCVVVACGGGTDGGTDGSGASTNEAGSTSAGASATGSGGQTGFAGETNTSAGTTAVGGTFSAGGGTSAAGSSTTGGEPNTGGTAQGGAAQGGTAAGGKSGEAGGSAGAAQAGAPSGLTFDYSLWQLQLPTGPDATDADTIQPSDLKAYSSTYFSKAADGGIVFADPISGPTTGNSEHPRSELREMKGNAGASWSVSGTNTMTVTGKAIKCPGACTIGQIFRSNPSGTLIELQYSGSSGKMQLLYEEVKGSPEPVKDLGVSVPLGQTYTYEFSLSNGQLDVTVNGKDAYTRKPLTAAVSGGVYFKAGDYDQSATQAATTSKTINSQIEVYSVVVVHQ